MTVTQVDSIYQDLHRSVVQGALAPESALPSLRTLAKRYDCSMGTVRAALGRMQADGQVEARHGSGYYITARAGVRTRMVLLIAMTEGDTWSEFMRLFCEKLAVAPDVCMITMSPPDAAGLAEFRSKVDRLIEQGLDAVIFDGSVHMELDFLEQYQSRTRLICYNMDYICRSWHCARVTTDYFHGGYAGVRHLLDEGARHIVFLVPYTFGRDETEDQTLLHEGCLQAVADYAQPAQVEVLMTRHRDPDIAQTVSDFLDARPSVDAIYSYCDFRFEHIIPMLARRGLAVPDDIRLLGYFDTPWCRSLTPHLSSVTIQPERIVESTLKLLETGEMRQVSVKPRVVPRASSCRVSRVPDTADTATRSDHE